MRAAAVAGVLVVAATQAASGQGLTAPAIGTGISGPATADAAAVYWNPGMLGFFDSGTMLVGGHAIVGDVHYQRHRRAIYQREDSLQLSGPIAPESIDAMKTGWSDSVTANPVGAAPTLFAAIPLRSKRLAFGFGVYAPYAGILDFDDSGAQRWQLQHATIAVINVNPVVSYRVHDRLSVGAGVSYVVGYADLAKVQDFAALDAVGSALENDPLNQSNDFGAQAPPSVRELSVTSRPIEIDNAYAHALTFNAGVAVRPTERSVVGLGYQHSVRMNFNGTFRLNMDDDFFTQDLASQGLEFAPHVAGDATLAFTLPRSLFLGGTVQLSDALAVGATAGYTTYSQTESFDVAVRSPDLAQPMIGLGDTARIALPRRWKDTVALDGSVHARIQERVRGWASVGFRSAASPDETIDVASIDGDRLVGNVGAAYVLSRRMTLLAEAKVQRVLEREVVASDFDLGNGRYSMTLFSLGGHVQLALP